MTFPAAGAPADLALLLADHHGAALIVTVGSTVSLDEFFDQGRRDTNPSAFMTRLKVGPKLVDAKAVATLYRSRVSGGVIALLVFAMVTLGHLRIHRETGARVPVLVVALSSTVIVLVTFAVTTLVEEPSTLVAIIAVLVLSIGADIGWKRSRDAHVAIS